MNPFEKHNGLFLNGKFYPKNELDKFIDKEPDDSFVKEILIFAHLLFNHNEYLTFQTSGSTGKPKQLNFSKNAIYASAQLTNRFFDLKKGKRALLSLPMIYVAAKMMVARALIGEYELISISPGSKPLQPGLKFQFAPFTPFQFEEIANHQLKLLPKNATILLGGSTVSNKLANKIRQIPNKVYLGFGMTETLTHFALTDIKSDPSFFKTLPGTDLKIDGKGALSVFRTGITDDWVYTNDIVELVPNGFKWKGRKDHIINSGGVKLQPEEIERDLAPHIHSPFFIYGVDDDKLGQKAVLFIEGTGNIDLTNVNYSKKYSKPRDIVFMEKFMWTDSGKIKRKATVDSWLKN